MSKAIKASLIEQAYRFRWLAALLSLFMVLVFATGGTRQVLSFSSGVDALKDEAPAQTEPRLFDMRTDIWFDPQDDGLRAYRDIEAQFIAEDTVIVAFEETEDPWGAFGKKSVDTIQRLTERIEKIPYVRSVRSLSSSPWIRWGEVLPSERGLLVSDLFEKPWESYSREERLERMIAVLGAEGAAKLAGKEAVAEAISGDAFENHPGEARFLDSIVSKDGKTAALQIQIIRQKPDQAALDDSFGEGSSNEKTVATALSAIESQAQAVNDLKRIVREESSYAVHIAGIPVLEQHFPEVGFHDMAFMGLMFLAMAAGLLLIFRRLGGVVLPLLVVTLSILGMNGLVWWTGDLINNLTATAPVVMTAVGLAAAVHLVTQYYHERPHHGSRSSLITAVVLHNWLPILLTSLTTAAAFFSLMVSKIEPVREFGYTAGFGTIIAWLLSMTLVPALLSLLPTGEVVEPSDPKEDESRTSSRILGRVLEWVLSRKRAVVTGALALVALAGLGMSQLRVESDLRLMFPSDDPITSDIRWIEQRLGGAGDLDLVFYGAESKDESAQANRRQQRIETLLVAEKSGAMSPSDQKELERLKGEEERYQRGRIASNAAFLQSVDRFERRLREEARDASSPISALTSFDSGLSVLRRMHQVQNENQTAFYRVPVDADLPEEATRPVILQDEVTGETTYIPAQSASSLSSQYYLQYENGARPTENLSALVTQDRRAFRIVARVMGAPSTDLLGTYQRIRELAHAEFPELAGTPEEVKSGKALSTMRMSGKHYLFINMLDRFTDTLLLSLVIASFVITLLIMLVFRSPTLALVSIVPNVLPLVIPLGLLGLLDIPLDGPAVIVATVALGVCVDDTIHFFSRFRKARAEGLDVDDALRQAVRQVGSALTWTTLVLVVGFAVLSLSAFRPNMMVGVLGAIMVALAWLADMLVTPALLSLLARSEPASEARPSELTASTARA